MGNEKRSNRPWDSFKNDRAEFSDPQAAASFEEDDKSTDAADDGAEAEIEVTCCGTCGARTGYYLDEICACTKL
ncbi:MAG: hypothetical protein ACLPYS_15575 [Vulcanimicrobiaceae bacterium]